MPPNAEKAARYGITAAFAKGELPHHVIKEIVEDYSNGIIKLRIADIYKFSVEDIKRAHLSKENKVLDWVG